MNEITLEAARWLIGILTGGATVMLLLFVLAALGCFLLFVVANILKVFSKNIFQQTAAILCTMMVRNVIKHGGVVRYYSYTREYHLPDDPSQYELLNFRDRKYGRMHLYIVKGEASYRERCK